jgi:mRNA-degrading endonuclease RelE of RelBE toxin-antitoxin system
MPERYSVELTETALGHLRSYRKSDSKSILNTIKRQLPYQAAEETRTRKLLRDNPLADWELRVGKFRVFYELDVDEHRVRIVAVGHKEHNRLFIGGEEIEL